MQKIFVLLAAGLMSAGLLLPALAAATGPNTYSGSVTKINGSNISFTNNTAAIYSAELNGAILTRKNGAPMQLSEIIVGDKIQVTGSLWADNSINASSFRDLSLYAHNSSFSGKIITIDPSTSSFVMQSKTYGNQTINTNNFTSFKKNGGAAIFGDLILGMSATVKGQWDRNYATVLASQVAATIKYINIDFTGTLTTKNGNALTVIGNGNVIYGVDVSKATLQDKNGKTVPLSQLNTSDIVHVWGKHVAGSVAIIGTKIKDSSIPAPLPKR